MLDRWSYYECFGDFPHTADAAEEMAKWREKEREDEQQRALQRREISRRADERRRRRRAGLAVDAEERRPRVQRPLSRWEKILARKPELQKAVRDHVSRRHKTEMAKQN